MAKNKTENENKDYYHIAKCFHPPISISRSSRSQMFFKIAVLKNYIIFTGKRKCCSLFNNVEGLVCNFIIICEIFKNRVFHRTSLVAASGQMSFLRLLVTFYSPIKTLENPDVFRGHKKTSGMKWIKAS